jgi:hypothetical protein
MALLVSPQIEAVIADLDAAPEALEAIDLLAP